MNCPACKSGHLEVKNVYIATDMSESRNLVCDGCGHRMSSVTFLVARPQARRRGFGGAALAKKLAQGRIEAPQIPQ